jgi:hypothetical protein
MPASSCKRIIHRSMSLSLNLEGEFSFYYRYILEMQTSVSQAMNSVNGIEVDCRLNIYLLPKLSVLC